MNITIIFINRNGKEMGKELEIFETQSIDSQLTKRKNIFFVKMGNFGTGISEQESKQKVPPCNISVTFLSPFVTFLPTS